MNPFEPQGQQQPHNYFAQPGGQPNSQPGSQPNQPGGQPNGNMFDDPTMFERTRPRPPRRPPSRFKRFAVSAVISVATAAACGGINALFDDDDDDEYRPRNNAVAATPTPTPSSTRASTTSAVPPTSRSATVPPSPTANPLDTVDKGDCLKNTGTDSDPEMVPAACAAGTYQVLKRIYGTIDANQCQSVSGATTTYTVTYYRNGITQIGQSYVFCLKKR